MPSPTHTHGLPARVFEEEQNVVSLATNHVQSLLLAGDTGGEVYIYDLQGVPGHVHRIDPDEVVLLRHFQVPPLDARSVTPSPL